MIKVSVYKQSNYPVKSVVIKRQLADFLTREGMVSDSCVSVALVGRKNMFTLAQRFLQEKHTLHNVLSFTESEVSPRLHFPAGEVINLGEIVVCFPKVLEEAGQENKMVEEKIMELVFHGAKHLMGVHH